MGAYNIVNPARLVAGQAEDVGDVLANLQAIATVLNGNIDDFNIKTAAAIAISKLAGYPADVTKVLRGDGSWGSAGAAGITNVSIGVANVDLAAPTGAVNLWIATTANGSLRSIGAGIAVGARITLKNAHASQFIRLLHATAGGTGQQLSIINAGHKFLAPGQSIELQYDGNVWQEVNRPGVETVMDYTVTGASIAAIDTDTVLGVAASLPQVYSHLRILMTLRGATAANATDVRQTFNNDAVDANYQVNGVYDASSTNTPGGYGGATRAMTGTSVPAGLLAAGYFAQFGMDIANYRGTTSYKIATYQWWGRDGTNFTPGASTMVWSNTGAINRIAWAMVTGNIDIGSRIIIEGIT